MRYDPVRDAAQRLLPGEKQHIMTPEEVEEFNRANVLDYKPRQPQPQHSPPKPAESQGDIDF